MWNRGELELFIQGDGDPHVVDVSDVRQGQAPNCWSMAGLCALAKRHPALLESKIQYVDNGYSVTIHHNGRPRSIVVYPTTLAKGPGNPAGIRPYAGWGDKLDGRVEVWPRVLEVAQQNLEFETKGRVEWTHSDLLLSKLSDSPPRLWDPFVAWTGRPAEWIPGDELGWADFYDDSEKLAIVVWSLGKQHGNVDHLDEFGIEANHGFAVMDFRPDPVFQNEWVIQLRDPRGAPHPDPDPVPADRASEFFHGVWVADPYKPPPDSQRRFESLMERLNLPYLDRLKTRTR